MNRRRAPFVGAVLLFLPLFAACVSVTNPDGWAAPVIDGQDVYVSTSKGHISAVTLQDGDSATARWTFPDKDIDADDKIEPEAIYGDPVVDGDRVYIATFSAGVFALNKADGRPAWPLNGTNASKIKGNIAGGLALANGILYFGTTEGRLYAWNASDGTPAWPEPKRFDRGIWATPVALGENLYVATMSGELHALSLADGSPAWIDPFVATGAIADLVALEDNRLFVPSINRHVYILNAEDGTVLADYRARDWVWTEPAVDGSRVFFGDFGGHVYGLDITSGPSQLWEPASVEGERVKAGAAVIGDVLVIADRSPTVTFINATTGEVLNRVPIDDAGTVRSNVHAGDGFAYVLTTKGRLYRANPQNYSVAEISLTGVKK
ncbi:MAG: PQQ-binding-like beta-propeller repeat protein [Dehalococcoidia bacterium]|nr:PQQ-binding-like beta-propeller repeat protein [Dehalococcoidia bacterium]